MYPNVVFLLLFARSPPQYCRKYPYTSYRSIFLILRNYCHDFSGMVIFLVLVQRALFQDIHTSEVALELVSGLKTESETKRQLSRSHIRMKVKLHLNSLKCCLLFYFPVPQPSNREANQSQSQLTWELLLLLLSAGCTL